MPKSSIFTIHAILGQILDFIEGNITFIIHIRVKYFQDRFSRVNPF